MIRTLLWKEYREQRVTAIALLVFASVTCIVIQVFGHSNWNDVASFGTTASCLTWMIGLIAGAQAFASEAESGTQVWLDSQPATRRKIGRTKIAFALAVVLVGSGILILIGASTGWMRWETPWIRLESQINTAMLVVICALSGLGCGLCGSAVARSSLAAIGMGILLQAIVFAVWLGLGLIWQSFLPNLVNPFVVGAILVLPLTFDLASRRFTRLDRLRSPTLRHRWFRPDSSWVAIVWLSWRQSKTVVLVVSVVGLVAAAFFPIDWTPPYWPAFGMAIGIMVGIGTFAVDRPGDACRFLSDRRFPLNRVWLVKVGVRLCALLLPVLMQLLSGWLYVKIRLIWGGGFHGYNRAIDSSNLLIGPLYGFALGLLLGMICRKGLVATVLAAMLGCFTLVAWWPSIVMTGLHIWQWLPPALVLIAATWFAMRPWVTGRLSDRFPTVGLLGASVFAVALLVLGVWWRIGEVPQLNDPFDVATFRASLPTPAQNVSGRRIAALLTTFPEPRYRHPDDLRPVDPNEWKQWADRYRRAMEAANRQLWPADDVELNQWLDEIFANSWFAEFRQAVALPLGMIEEVGGKSLVVINNAVFVGNLLAARMLQQASRGHAADAFDACFVALALSRQLRSNTTGDSYFTGSSTEQLGLRMLPRIIQLSTVQSDLLASAVSKLVKHDQSVPSLTETLKIDYLASEGRTLKQLTEFDANADVTEQFRRIAMHVPWEQVRIRGIRASLFAGYFRTSEISCVEAIQRIGAVESPVDLRNSLLDIWTPQATDESKARAEFRKMWQLLHSNWPGTHGPQLYRAEIVSQTRRRATELEVALALYELRHERPAATLADLVPDCLQELPLDPTTQRLFGYRVSPTVQFLSAGKGVLWNTNSDGRLELGPGSRALIQLLLIGENGVPTSFGVPQVKKP